MLPSLGHPSSDLTTHSGGTTRAEAWLLCVGQAFLTAPGILSTGAARVVWVGESLFPAILLKVHLEPKWHQSMHVVASAMICNGSGH